MKSIWIVQMIKLGDEYAQSMSDKLWECYVRELDEVGYCSTFVVSRSGRTLSPVQQKCQREFSRFTKKELPSKRLKEPDIRTLKLLREEEFGILLEDEEDEFDYQPGLDYLNEILHMYVLFLSQFLQDLRKDKTSGESWQKSQRRACPSSTG